MTSSIFSKNSNYHYLKGWFSANFATPDWFDSCSGPTLFRVPNNYIGYQLPRSGKGYAGTMIQKQFRKYLQTVLDQPLKKYRKYFVKYYINRGGDEYPKFMGCDRLGVHFAKDTFFEQTPGKIMLFPHLITPDDLYFIDTLNWTEITDTFISNGGEKVVIFGNFDKAEDIKFVNLGNN